MKKRFTLFSAAMQAMLMVPLLASAAGYLNRISHTASYDYSNMDIGTDTLGGVAYATVACEDMYNDGNPGMPSLPIDYIRFSVPYNATNFTVTATGVRWSSQNLDHMVFPCQVPWFTDGSPAPAITLPDSAAYFSGNPYPSQMAWIADEGFLAGENHIVTVAVMPLRYSHSATADVLSGARRCSLTLSYDLSDSLAMYPIVRNDSLLREEGYQLTQSMVVNPAQVKGFAPLTQVSTGIDSIGFIGGDGINGGSSGIDGPGPINPPLDPPGVDTTGIGTGEALVTGNYTYLIVTTPELKHAVRRIAALKRQKGYNVKIVTMDDVLSSPLSGPGDLVGEGSNAHLTFTDHAGKLRQFLRNYYKFLGTQYVLLVGKGIPYRMHDLHMITGGHGDLYYSELNCDWFDADSIETNPEIYVGRLLCSTPEQVEDYTNKLFTYELDPGKGDYSYLNRALFTEGRTYLRNLRLLMNDTKTIFPYQTVIRDSLEIGDYPKGSDVVDTINTVHFGFMCSLNHGAPSGIKIYGEDSNYKRYFLWAIDSVNSLYGKPDSLETNNGLNRFTNKNEPMVYYSLACQTMPYHIIDSLEVEVNFGESFTMGKDYGGPAYLGYTTQSFANNEIALCQKFFKQVKMNYPIGKAEAISKYLYNGGNKESMAIYHNLLGDPALLIWPRYLGKFNNIPVIRTDTSIVISKTYYSPTYVAYSCNDGRAGCLKVSGTMNSTLSNISPNSSIMVFSNNRIPYIAPLLLQYYEINKSEYVIASDVIAGNSIDSNRTNGDVTVKNGAEFEIEASGTVTLDDGFQVEKGATFAVYPPCF